MEKPLPIRFLAVPAAVALAATLAVTPAAPCFAAEPATASASDADVAQALAGQLERFAADATAALGREAPGRISVQVGTLDPRLRLSPCARIEPYLPRGTRLWGKAHIGVRCLEGPRRWNVYLPITVSVHARALVAAGPLAAGAVIGAADLSEAEIDVAAARGSVFTDPQSVLGRTLQRAVAAGDGIRSDDLKPRQWFAAGDTVRISTTGGGFAVRSSGEALTPGLDGQSVRVRTAGGRIVSGIAVGDREVALPL